MLDMIPTWSCGATYPLPIADIMEIFVAWFSGLHDESAGSSPAEVFRRKLVADEFPYRMFMFD